MGHKINSLALTLRWEIAYHKAAKEMCYWQEHIVTPLIVQPRSMNSCAVQPLKLHTIPVCVLLPRIQFSTSYFNCQVYQGTFFLILYAKYLQVSNFNLPSFSTDHWLFPGLAYVFVYSACVQPSCRQQYNPKVCEFLCLFTDSQEKIFIIKIFYFSTKILFFYSGCG